MKDNSDNTNICSSLFEIINRLYQLYEKLLIVSQEVSLSISEGKFDQLADLLNKKQAIIDQIDDVNVSSNFQAIKEKILETYQIGPENWLVKLAEKNKEIDSDQKKLIEEFNLLLKQLANMDKINRDDLGSIFQKTNQGLQKVKNGIKINNKYNKHTRIYSTFIDQKVR